MRPLPMLIDKGVVVSGKNSKGFSAEVTTDFRQDGQIDLKAKKFSMTMIAVRERCAEFE
jgi:hypothetical protein